MPKGSETAATEPKLLKLALQIIADAPVKMYMQASKAAEMLQYIEQLEAAITDEREACAKIAENYPGLDSVGYYVAKQIRARTKGAK